MSARYVILGAGISGLSLAFLLKQKEPAAQITLLEKSVHSGGWIDTQLDGDFLFEMGPRSLRPQGKGLYTLQLIEQLNLQDMVIKADPAAKIRYLYENQRLNPLPHNFYSFITSPYTPLLVKAAWRDWMQPAKLRPDETIFAFASRHFGKDFAERLMDPLCKGIFAGDCQKLSVQACFPLWAEMERTYGSLMKAAFKGVQMPVKHIRQSPWMQSMQKEPLYSFKNGLGTLVKALKDQIKESLLMEKTAVAIHSHPGYIEVVDQCGQTYQADRLYSTLSVPALYKLLDTPIDLNIPTASIATVAVGFNTSVLKHTGFGYLIPSREKESILGVVWDSSAFPAQNRHPLQTRLTVMLDALPAVDYQKCALDALARHLHITAAPSQIKIKVAMNAIPHYQVGHASEMKNFLDYAYSCHPRLALLGTLFHGVSVNDCIAQAFTELYN